MSGEVLIIVVSICSYISVNSKMNVSTCALRLIHSSRESFLPHVIYEIKLKE